MLHPSGLHDKLATAGSRHCHGMLDLSHPVCCSLRGYPDRGKGDGRRYEATIRPKATTSLRLYGRHYHHSPDSSMYKKTAEED